MLRVASSFMITLPGGTKLTCAEAVKRLVKDKRRWEIRSAGNGSKDERWYAWAWIGTDSPQHHLLVRRHLKTGEQDFRTSKDCLGLDQCQARLYTALLRHIVLVMAPWPSAPSPPPS